jgi:hypothetical protein
MGITANRITSAVSSTIAESICGHLGNLMLTLLSSISVSPECSFPSVRVGPTYANTILAFNASLVDYVNVMHLASQVCSWGSVDRAGFWNAVTQWASWAAASGSGIQIVTGLPIWGWGFESWVNAMVGDFLYPDELYGENVVGRLKSYKAFAGFALWDDSYEYVNVPCESMPERYSQILYNELRTAIVGSDSAATKTCVRRKSAPTLAVVPSKTSGATPSATASRRPSNSTCTAWWCKNNGGSGSTVPDPAPLPEGQTQVCSRLFSVRVMPSDNVIHLKKGARIVSGRNRRYRGGDHDRRHCLGRCCGVLLQKATDCRQQRIASSG